MGDAAVMGSGASHYAAMHLGHVYSYSALRSSAVLAPGSLAALDLQSGRKGERSGVIDVLERS